MLGDFKGYGSPQTRRGIASPYGAPPWHMSGRALTVWYRPQDPGEIRNLVAPPLTVPDDALCRARFWDLQHNAGLGDDRLAANPPQTRFHEAVLAVDVSYGDTRGDYSVHIQSDDPIYTAWAREVIGWPVKMADVYFNHAWQPHNLQPGVTFTGILSRFGTQTMRASVTLTAPIKPEDRPYQLANWYTYKVIPSAETYAPEVCQLILVQPQILSLGTMWQAEGTLELGAGLNDELHFLQPKEIVFAEYWSFVELSVGYGKILERLA